MAACWDQGAPVTQQSFSELINICASSLASCLSSLFSCPTAVRPDPHPTLHPLWGHKDYQTRKGASPTRESPLCKFPSEATLPPAYEVTQRRVWKAIFRHALS